MSFVSNALGISNGYSAPSAAGPNGQITQDPNLVANAQAANTNYGTTNTNQSALAAALLAQSQGQGPNIANLQLQQATNQNNQQAAGEIASQRGMNPALAQRIISQQQATNNQNAAGQSGVLRAQQQLAAQQGLANVYGQQATEANANTSANLSGLGNQNNAIVGAVNSANQINGQVAQNNTNQNAGIAGGIMNGVGSMMSMFSEGGQVKKLERMVVPPGKKVHPLHLFQGGDMLGNFPVNQIDPGMAAGPSADANNLFGATAKPIQQPGNNAPGGGGGGGGGGGSGGFMGGLTNLIGGSGSPMSGATDISGAGGSAGEGDMAGAAMMAAKGGKVPRADIPHYDSGGGIMSMLPMLAMLAAKGGKVPAMLSPGELYIPPHKVPDVASGKEKASEAGKRVPGKAKVKGNNLKNDTFPAELETGGVVIKRTEADNDKDAREFLLAIKADKDKKNGPSGYAKVLAAKRKNA